MPEKDQCDGEDDCGDGSDEHECGFDNCRPDEFLCDNWNCVPEKAQCDGEDDCGDGSDEHECG